MGVEEVALFMSISLPVLNIETAPFASPDTQHHPLRACCCHPSLSGAAGRH